MASYLTEQDPNLVYGGRGAPGALSRRAAKSNPATANLPPSASQKDLLSNPTSPINQIRGPTTMRGALNQVLGMGEYAKPAVESAPDPQLAQVRASLQPTDAKPSPAMAPIQPWIDASTLSPSSTQGMSGPRAAGAKARAALGGVVAAASAIPRKVMSAYGTAAKNVGEFDAGLLGVGGGQAAAPAPAAQAQTPSPSVTPNPTAPAQPGQTAAVTPQIQSKRYGDTSVLQQGNSFTDAGTAAGIPARGTQARQARDQAEAERAAQAKLQFEANTTTSDGRRVFGGADQLNQQLADAQVETVQGKRGGLSAINDAVVTRQLRERGQTPQQQAAYDQDPLKAYAVDQDLAGKNATAQLASQAFYLRDLRARQGLDQRSQGQLAKQQSNELKRLDGILKADPNFLADSETANMVRGAVEREFLAAGGQETIGQTLERVLGKYRTGKGYNFDQFALDQAQQQPGQQTTIDPDLAPLM